MDDDPIDLVLPHIQDSGSVDLYLAEWLANDYQSYLDPSKSDALSQSLSGYENFGQHLHSRSLDSPEISFLPGSGSSLLPHRSLEEAAGHLSLDQATLVPNPDLAQSQEFLPNRNFNQPSGPAPLSVFPQELNVPQESNLLHRSELPATAGLDSNQNLHPDNPALPIDEKLGSRQTSHDLEPNNTASLDAHLAGPRYALRTRSVARQQSLRISDDSLETESLSSQASDAKEKRRRRGSGAFGKAFNTMEQVAKGGAAAVTSLLPKKRSRDPVIIKEKEKARNRRSQKAFRQRQKDLQSQRESSMKVLQQSVQNLGFENESLRGEVEALRTSHQLFVGQHFRAPSSGDLQETRATTETPLSISFEQNNVRSISVSGLQAITMLELVEIWKGYVATLGDLLESTSLQRSESGLDSSPSPAASEQETANNPRMEILLREVTRLIRSIAILQPDLFLRFHSTNMETMQEQKATRGHWRSVVAMIELDEAQRQAILQGRRDSIAQLAKLLDQRNQLISIQSQMLEAVKQDNDFHTNDITSTHEPAFEAVNEMNRNLKAEQALIIREMCSMQQNILRLPQLAQFISYSWPYYPGKLEAASVLAQKCGEPATSLLLYSGLQTAAQMRTSQA